jgi:hypothetical protein
MIRKLLNEDIDRVADIWLKTNLKTHYFISNQYWKSNYELVKEMMSQYEVYVFEADKMIQGFVGLNDKYMKEMDPEDEQVQLQVRKLQDYITDHFYTCSDKILCGLGRMYAGGGELTENIDDVGGVGTAEFASKAIDIFYMSRR